MDVLLELGCEELPAVGLSDLAQELARSVQEGLQKRGLEGFDARALWTPRRLTVKLSGLAAAAADQTVERRGPAVNASIDAAGQPSKALMGFAASCGVDVAALQKLETDKGAWFVHRALVKGKDTRELLPEVIQESVSKLSIPKPMRWGDNGFSFLRPVHWLVLLADADVVPMSLFGLQSGRTTYGHRFHAPAAIELSHVSQYEAALLAAYVQVNPAARAQQVRNRSIELAKEINGNVQMREALVDEVVNLSEWPVPIRAEIPVEFMSLPQATIITTIETHQRYFPIVDAKGELMPYFIGVANVESTQPSEIRKGYERVVKPRLKDADFFYQQDLQTPLANFQAQLANVTFQTKLGTVLDKSKRVAALARSLAPSFAVDSNTAEAAAMLAKCDLMSRMVNEFPELQGAMGKTYAQKQGLSQEVALSLDEVYEPRNASSGIATSALGRLLAVCERLDTLAGIFAAGIRPTGNKDAFALRRAALGVARTLIEGEVALDLPHALQQACRLQPIKVDAGLADELYQFLIERLRAYFNERSVTNDVLDAVERKRVSQLTDFSARLRACQSFKASAQSQSLAAANKRIGNLLKKLDSADQARLAATTIDTGLFESDEERALHQAVQSAKADTAPLLAAALYEPALARLSTLRPFIDSYFDKVMVMSDNAGLKFNRLAGLQQLSEQFLAIADISMLVSDAA